MDWLAYGNLFIDKSFATSRKWPPGRGRASNFSKAPYVKELKIEKTERSDEKKKKTNDEYDEYKRQLSLSTESLSPLC